MNIPMPSHQAARRSESFPHSKPDDGELHRGRSEGADGIDYLLYLPRDPDPAMPLLTVVHGIARNPADWLKLFRPSAQRWRAPLVAPLFDGERYGDFQRLGRHGRGARADHALIRMTDELAVQHGAPRRMALFGFSGGAQFAHRFAMAHPARVSALALGAAGWYSWPDPVLAYPRGTRSVSSLPGVQFDSHALLGMPLRVLVGEKDTGRDPSLNRRTAIDRLQGSNRLERARRWVRALEKMAAAQNRASQVELRILPGADHDVLQSADPGLLREWVADWLLQARGARA